MNRNLMIVLAGGFLIAVLVALLVQSSLSSGKKKDVTPAAQDEPKIQIIVAAKPIKVGDELTADNLKYKSWPKSAVFPGAFVQKGEDKPADIAKGRARRAFALDEPIVADALVPANKAALLAAVLREDMRAIAVDVEASSMVGGFIAPSDFVDVILIYKEKIKYEGSKEDTAMKNYIQNQISSFAVETVLENIRVLAVDQAPVRDEEVKAKVGKTVTLEVDRKGAETLALASKMGTLSLALRRLGDDKIYGYQYPVLTDARLTNVYDEVWSELSKRQNTSGKVGNIVRIYTADSLKEVSVTP